MESLFAKILTRLHLKLDEEGLLDWSTWHVDSTTSRAHRSAAGGRKKSLNNPQAHALGRSRGGFSSKIHPVCEGNGIPLGIELSGANCHDAPFFEAALETVSIPQPNGRPKNRPLSVYADKGYDSSKIRTYLRKRAIKANIPQKALRAGTKRRKRDPKPKLDKRKYKERNAIERLIGWLK